MSNPLSFGSGPFNFGANTNNANNTTNPTPPAASGQANIFGGAAPATTGGIFGGFGTGPGTAASTGTQSKPLFSGFSTGNASATTPGSGTAPGATAGGGLFGGGSGFGATGGSSNMFGKLAGTTATSAGTPSGGLFGNATATAPPTGGNLFGPKPTATTPAPASGTPAASTTSATAPVFPLFGNVTKPAEPSGGATTTSMFGGFSKPATAPTGGLFGNNATPTTSAPSPIGAPGNNAPTQKSTGGAAPTPPAGGLFGALGAAPSSKDPVKDANTKTAETSSAVPATTNLFGGTGLGKASGTSAPGAAPPLFGGFNPPATQDKDKDSAKPAAPLFGGAIPAKTPEAFAASGIPKSAPAPQPSSSTAPAATTAAPATSTDKPPQAPLIPPSVLKGKTMEDIVNQWNTDLEAQAKEFQRLAGEVEVWDRVLNDNAKQISNVYAMVLQAETTQANVESSLDQIESQQKQVADSVEGFAKLMESPSVQEGLGLDIGAADSEREKTYALATSLNTQMDELARSLTAMIDEVNSVTAPSHSTGMRPADNTNTLGPSNSQKRDMLEDDSDPMLQIQGILNAHLESLTWINGTVKELEGKVVDLEKKFGNALPENNPAPSLSRSSTRGLSLQRTLLEGSSVGSGSRFGGSSIYGFSR